MVFAEIAVARASPSRWISRSTTTPVAARRRRRSSPGCRRPSRPVLIVGVEVHRFQLREQVIRLAERLQHARRVVISRARCVPHAPSAVHRDVSGRWRRRPRCATSVEQSDCVLLLGELDQRHRASACRQLPERANLLDLRRARRLHSAPSLSARAARPPGGTLLSRPTCPSRRPRAARRSAASVLPSVLEPSRRGPDQSAACDRRAQRVSGASMPRCADRVRHRRLPVCERGHPRATTSSRRPTTRRWGLPSRRRSACRSRAAAGRWCSWATARFR